MYIGLWFIGICFLLLTGIFCIQYYFKQTTDACISNPFVYGAKQLEEQYTVKVNGLVSFWDLNHVRIHFNSEEQFVENDRDQKLFLPI